MSSMSAEQRKATLMRHRERNSAHMVGIESYEAAFKAFAIFPSNAALEQFSEFYGRIFCPACEVLTPVTSGMSGELGARALFVTHAPDPLGNASELWRCVCHGCGFEEYHLIPNPELTIGPITSGNTQYQQLQQLQQQQQLQLQRAPNPYVGNSGIGNSLSGAANSPGSAGSAGNGFRNWLKR